MEKRFKIEDIDVQDSSGIVFRATDTETDGPVAVRRFFPFGPTSVGLNAEDQESYRFALGQFAEIRHPALRTFISGGCDAVDGMPYIIAEWVEGDLLDLLLDHRPLSEPEAVALIHLALDACEALSGAIGSEGVWIETAPNTIVIRPVGAQRPFNFWISPLRWLGRTIDPRGLKPLIGLTESIMDLVGQPTESLPDKGMGGWLKWLHGAAATASLREARAMLAKFTGTEPPPAAVVPAAGRKTDAATPAKAKIKSRSRVPALMLACGALLALGLGGWMLIRRNEALLAVASAPPESRVKILTAKDRPPESAPSRPVEVEESVPAIVAAPAAGKAGMETMRVEKKAPKALPKKKSAEEELNDRRQLALKRGYYLPSEGDLLIAAKNKEVTLEGQVANVQVSRDGKAPIYLEFSQSDRRHGPRGYVVLRNPTEKFSEKSIMDYEGKKVRIRGKLRVKGKRLEIEIKDSAAINSVP